MPAITEKCVRRLEENVLFYFPVGELWELGRFVRIAGGGVTSEVDTVRGLENRCACVEADDRCFFPSRCERRGVDVKECLCCVVVWGSREMLWEASRTDNVSST